MPGVDLRIGTTAPGLDAATRLGPGRAPDLYADFERGDWRYAGGHHGTAADWLAAAGGSGAGWTLTFGPVVVGEERLTNGGFDSGIAGWSAAPGWPATLSHVGGRLRNTYGSGGQTRLQTTASVTPGRAYRLTGTVTASSSGSLQLASSPAGAGVYGPNIGSLPTPATGESLFAVDSSSWAVGANSNPGAAGFDEWDDFS
ncbi:hypothetical protein GVN24_34250, partial [Rhizobium sp. CRIBSB]|nr:hypothetical protein [Rhizobium sp. CRIBSB]